MDREELGMAHLRVTPFSCFFHFHNFSWKDFLFSCISLKYVSLLAFGVRVSLVMFAVLHGDVVS